MCMWLFRLIDYLRFYVPLKNISLIWRDVTIACEGLQNLGLCSALRAFEQGGIFIVPHLLWRETSFLAHLSWKLKWAILIARCPSSICPSVCLSVCKLLHFRLLLQNHWANINQTWHKSSLGGGNSKLFKWRGLPFSKGR
jgi:hypothetical protein